MLRTAIAASDAGNVSDERLRRLRVQRPEGEYPERVGPDRHRVDVRPGLEPSGKVGVRNERGAREHQRQYQRERRGLDPFHCLQRQANERGHPGERVADCDREHEREECVAVTTPGGGWPDDTRCDAGFGERSRAVSGGQG
jgi:hypothetical protein